jgi:hypothetical protein
MPDFIGFSGCSCIVIYLSSREKGIISSLPGAAQAGAGLHHTIAVFPANGMEFGDKNMICC